MAIKYNLDTVAKTLEGFVAYVHVIDDTDGSVIETCCLNWKDKATFKSDLAKKVVFLKTKYEEKQTVEAEITQALTEMEVIP